MEDTEVGVGLEVEVDVEVEEEEWVVEAEDLVPTGGMKIRAGIPIKCQLVKGAGLEIMINS